MSLQKIPLSAVVFDKTTQTRWVTDTDTVEKYAEEMRAGTQFPAPDVWREGKKYFIGDGWHRLRACQENGEKEVLCAVHEQGGRLGAIEHALGANTTHGFPRGHVDKRRAVMVALREFPDWSDRKIAGKCVVSNHLVADVRQQVDESSTSKKHQVGEFPPATSAPIKRIGADGKSYRVPARKEATAQAPQEKPDLGQPAAFGIAEDCARHAIDFLGRITEIRSVRARRAGFEQVLSWLREQGILE